MRSADGDGPRMTSAVGVGRGVAGRPVASASVGRSGLGPGVFHRRRVAPARAAAVPRRWAVTVTEVIGNGAALHRHVAVRDDWPSVGDSTVRSCGVGEAVGTGTLIRQ